MVLQEQESPAPFPADDPVLAIAREMFIQDGWIDVRRLGTVSGVSRATLYRRYGDRDRILGEVVWSQASADLAGLREQHRGRGATGIAESVEELVRISFARHSMRTFLGEHTDTALRVLSSRHGVVQQRLITTVVEWIIEEIGEPADIDSHSLAYAVVRLAESFYYREFITGEPADPGAAGVIIGRVLR
ncbi:QsdR family transcriptional regulator [Nocardia sp. NPDC051570]|uniref:QsdR family transcriptional regulator n=1 Tax=Nocardia sp. NPDC051570 TaxID=3364324 RepID=UPI00379FF0EB